MHAWEGLKKKGSKSQEGDFITGVLGQKPWLQGSKQTRLNQLTHYGNHRDWL
jgi:hypothetical protein